jgi:kynureninase
LSARFDPSKEFALELDGTDSLASYRERFHLPRDTGGEPKIYFAGNSLGLQPKSVEERIRHELEDWARLAVDAHFAGRTPWFSYHETVRDAAAQMVGAHPGEVVMMNGLTVNLHLMMVSFYRPTKARYKILMEDAAFPSDTYAAQSQLRFHGYDPGEGLIVARSAAGRPTLTTDEIEGLIDRRGDEIALVLLSGVNYYTGQAFDLKRIAARAKAKGCVVGYDLAHAAGNLELRLHDWEVDFAVWCSYKYLNAGPGAVGGIFVHEKHAPGQDLPRFAGWWGNAPETRFRMHLEPNFIPAPTADGWQLSNPPILAMAPLGASLEIFEEVGMRALREKSERLTGYLMGWIDHAGGGWLESLTPREPEARGCQVSIRVLERAHELYRALERGGIVGDFRPPEVVRVAPVPLYNSFHEVWRLGQVLSAWSGGRAAHERDELAGDNR